MSSHFTSEVSAQIHPRIAFLLVVVGALSAFAVSIPVAASLVILFTWMVDGNALWMSWALGLAGFTWLFSYGTCYGCMSRAVSAGLSSASQYKNMVFRSVIQVALTVAGVLTVYLFTWKTFLHQGWARSVDSPESKAAFASVGVLIVYSMIWSLTTSAFENFVEAPTPAGRGRPISPLNNKFDQQQRERSRRTRPTRSSCPLDPN